MTPHCCRQQQHYIRQTSTLKSHSKSWRQENYYIENAEILIGQHTLLRLFNALDYEHWQSRLLYSCEPLNQIYISEKSTKENESSITGTGNPTPTKVDSWFTCLSVHNTLTTFPPMRFINVSTIMTQIRAPLCITMLCKQQIMAIIQNKTCDQYAALWYGSYLNIILQTSQ